MGTRSRSACAFLSFPLLLYFLTIPSECATDTLTHSQPIAIGQTLISAGEVFELGFFSPGNSSKLYIGLWYKNITVRKIVWVANRENPLPATDSASSLIIGSDGNLRLLDGMRNTFWSTNISLASNNTVAVLLDKGDFVLKDNVSGFITWESFDYPCDTFLADMMIGLNTKTGEKHFLSSWETDSDPSPGKFVLGLTPETPPQLFLWNSSKPYWRGGPWNGWTFIGIPNIGQGYVNGLILISDNEQGTAYLTFSTYNISYVIMNVLAPTGTLKTMNWDEEKSVWFVSWVAVVNPCDIYGVCGPFGVCSNRNGSPICECLKGFVPKSTEDWSKGNWTGGCVRRTELLCQKNISSLANGTAQNDGFWKLSGLKLPDHFEYLFNQDYSGCQQWCVSNCSCVAYAYVTGIACMVWAEDLVDVQQFSIDGNDLFLRLAYSELGIDHKKSEKITIIFTTISGVILLAAFMFGLHRWRANQRVKRRKRIKGFGWGDRLDMLRDPSQDNVWVDHATHSESSELPMLDFDKVLVATNNFSITNKLGQGGFGPVYWGKLEGGQEAAVKRLSIHSGQGAEEFKNEIKLISKLQHRNLVRLLGYCIDGEEKLLVYEYMTNRSLDTFLFDAKKRMQLDWAKRFNIIQGIARGILYLHRDSCLRVIHRDLKASNILLDDDMNPKISDFGLARTFQLTQELANTHRVMGTFGYMSPEYAMGGLFSEKSDVFSFGVLLLEIVSGTRNTSLHYNEKYLNLLGYAWQLCNKNRELELMDEAMAYSCSRSEVMRCIHIGLLCVQDHAADRPTMSAVVLMLSSEMDLPQPKQPTFTIQSLSDADLLSLHNKLCSMNAVSVSIIEGR
ncbi:G-type lectin S-receptor-like serine/threonine-protein kinase SD1-29 isoform X1 [Camellia sinensis]|uniref:G-type lectin S-receptor-like serine/threonine-protein kinase SD1-29 isoform X1 n=1 Tax=Camellia sinensis TaxID=4442 RepID=UPI001035BA01|nr:G-type lectin S-receptor-like serine/threonine-protein kinase SD1-29 isoform X1 [Camellia sinensis]XP_028097301.1 G-type lectin S-receptor-like serine/threonine-protein kinase SD1-29 isoform X1 [Camellia sinensis]XP_028097302.1 G-type lectin S-receptor-like serine/threonine-protein kinase SD1-29 isoform X1 [Camellia sinensis]XP_028097303.1 G-type lectin S-receptor-like serine/threonine-protein kinase SD1-29 isoform X1 [Camellia sinensis]